MSQAFATTADSERAAQWLRLFGVARLPLLSPHMEVVQASDGAWLPVFLVDIELLDRVHLAVSDERLAALLQTGAILQADGVTLEIEHAGPFR